MLVRLQAVQWTLGKGISFDDLFGRLNELRAVHLDKDADDPRFNKKRRQIYVAKHDGKWIGLLITFRNARSRFKHVEGDGTIEIKREEDQAGTRDIAWNVFVVNPSTGAGTYSHYHESMSFDHFTRWCREYYEEIKSVRVAKEVEQLRIAQPDLTLERRENRARSKFARSLKGDRLVTKKQADQLVQELRSIESVSLTFSTVTPLGGRRSSPLEGFVKRERREVFLDSTSAGAAVIRDGVRKFIRDADAEDGRVSGVGQDGFAHVIHLNKNAGVFEHADFDRLAMTLKFDIDALHENAVIKRMLAYIATKPTTFTKPTKPKKAKKAAGK